MVGLGCFNKSRSRLILATRLLIVAQTFMRRQQRLQHARAKRDAVEEIVRADRYMRRAANQLVKALKASLNGL